MPDLIKQNGVHYTPTNLAAFLARQTLGVAGKSRGFVDVLDPACGDGKLLVAIAAAAKPSFRRRMRLFGFEQDPAAAEQARMSLAGLDVAQVQIIQQDFLSSIESAAASRYDIVIANPPYVRTQVLGAASAQSLAKRFGLTGRVDLYHAFSIAMSRVLREGGALGLLTSNRFLTIKSGIDLRRSLHDQFEITAVIDLGDTKLFSASVLPVIVVARKKSAAHPSQQEPATFSRVYESRTGSSTPSRHCVVFECS